MRAALPPWDPELDDGLVCLQVRRETADVRSFVFAARQPARFVFRPGQFLTFTFALEGGPVSRCYTIASPPTRPDRIAITVKRVAGGPVSNWLHDHLLPGMSVQAIGPFGTFVCDPAPPRKLLFLSAGSGITPLMSMARTADDLASGADILFVHSAHTPADILFRDEMTLLARHRSGLRAVAVCSGDSEDEIWAGHRGRITAPMLAAIAPDLLERDIYLCGPLGYREAVGGMLAQRAGFDPTRLHQESFDVSTLTGGLPGGLTGGLPGALPEPPAPPQAVSWRAEFTRSRQTVLCAPGSSLLQSARAAGLRLPASCTKGMCGTCKSRLLSGTVSMQHAGGIRQREIDAGMILICCSQPTSDVVIER